MPGREGESHHRRNVHGLSRKQEFALVLLEESHPGVVYNGPTARIDGQTWVHWRTAWSLHDRRICRVRGEGEATVVDWA